MAAGSPIRFSSLVAGSPAPPSTVRFAVSANPQSVYTETVDAYARRLEAEKFKVERAATQGSADNVRLLREGKVDLALVQGGVAPAQNKFGVDLSQQQPAETPAWYAPSMYNLVKQDGRDVHVVIKPDQNCVVNSGLGSIRGARMAEEAAEHGPHASASTRGSTRA